MEAVELLKAILVKPGEFPEMQEFEDFESIQQAVGAKDGNFDTALFNDAQPPYEGIGIVMNDQDRRGKKNMFELKGAFVVVGMDRLEPDSPENPHMFESLTDEQIKMVTSKLNRIKVFAPYRR